MVSLPIWGAQVQIWTRPRSTRRGGDQLGVALDRHCIEQGLRRRGAWVACWMTVSPRDDDGTIVAHERPRRGSLGENHGGRRRPEEGEHAVEFELAA
jgi:hypothetical protein